MKIILWVISTYLAIGFFITLPKIFNNKWLDGIRQQSFGVFLLAVFIGIISWPVNFIGKN